MGLIEVNAVSKKYIQEESEFRALEHVSLSVEKGEFICLLGPSGCGKTTLLNAAAGFERIDSGSIFIDGKEVETPSPDYVTVFQHYGLLPWKSVEKNVMMGLLAKKYKKQEAKERADSYLKLVGLERFKKFKPWQLSGGMQQRVSIARALAGSPSLILADEPTGALDSKTSRDVLGFLKQLNDEGNTIVMITHDNAIAMEARRVVRIKDGQINFDGDVKDYAAII